MVRDEARDRVAVKARENAEERLLDLLFPAPTKVRRPAGITPEGNVEVVDNDSHKDTREKLRKLLNGGHLNDREVELEVSANAAPNIEVFTPQGMEEMGLNMKELMNQLMPKKTRTRKVKIPEALELLTAEEAARLVDMEAVAHEAITRAEQSGIVFIDEIDKIAGRESHGPDVSREGVQRDLLPIVEGSTVNTKYGAVKTDHILFVASGAFHTSKPSDLIPEFQGRFPIRVELKALTREDFIRILTEPENALTRQYVALMETEGVQCASPRTGSRRWRRSRPRSTRARKISARAGCIRCSSGCWKSCHSTRRSCKNKELTIDAAYVHGRLDEIVKDEDLSRYIL